MSVFDRLRVEVRAIAEDFGIVRPTPPQAAAIPPILERKNVLLIAPTGTGKTEAALLPIFSLLASASKASGIKILYIAPLRALNRDMLKRFEGWAERLGLSVVVRHGDTTLAERRRQAIEPPDMLITTPETLQAILPGKRFREHLRAVKWVIVDEVHELFGDKRGVQLSVGLERLGELAGDFQRIGLSATVGDTQGAAEFLGGKDREVLILDTTAEKRMKVRVESPVPTEADAKLADELGVEPTTAARLKRLSELILQHPSTLVFVNTREMAEFLGSKLRAMGVQVGVHHGSLARDSRIEAEEGFRSGRLRSLICTSSMELGIDIGRVSLTVQYSSPRQAVRLTQRVGRAGHRIDLISKGVIISTSPEDAAEGATIAKRAEARKLEAGGKHEQCLDVLAHQIVGILLEKGSATLPEIQRIITRAAPYRGLRQGELSAVIEQLKSLRLVSESWGRLRPRRGSFEYYFSNLSMIPDTKRYEIRELASRRVIGHLDEEFVVANVEPETTFVCRGETWKVTEVDGERGAILVEPFEDPMGAIPSWEGELIPVPREVAMEVGALRRRIEAGLGRPRGELVGELLESSIQSREVAEWLVDEVAEASASGFPVPSDRRLVIERAGEFVILHAHFGSQVNRTLGWVMGELISARVGTSVRVRCDPYRIAFMFPGPSRPELISEILRELSSKHLEGVLLLTLKNSSMFRWRLVHVAKRSGAVKRDADLTRINPRKLVESFSGTPVFYETYRELLVDKLDLEGAREVLLKIKRGEFELVQVSSTEPSVYAWYTLNQLSGGELIIPRRAEREILRAVCARLERKPITLFCLNCLGWKSRTRVGRLPERVRCGHCDAGLLTLLPKEHEPIVKLLREHARGKKLGRRDQELVERAFRIADLVLTHGRRALVVLAGRGVGPRAARRILSRSYRSEEDFYREILRAERTYARTRRFWEGK